MQSTQEECFIAKTALHTLKARFDNLSLEWPETLQMSDFREWFNNRFDTNIRNIILVEAISEMHVTLDREIKAGRL